MVTFLILVTLYIVFGMASVILWTWYEPNYMPKYVMFFGWPVLILVGVCFILLDRVDEIFEERMKE